MDFKEKQRTGMALSFFSLCLRIHPSPCIAFARQLVHLLVSEHPAVRSIDEYIVFICHLSIAGKKEANPIWRFVDSAGPAENKPGAVEEFPLCNQPLAPVQALHSQQLNLLVLKDAW